jgi:hypothetical protein
MRRENSVVVQLLDLPGVWVVGVSFGQRDVSVDVRLRRRRLACPYCEHVSWFRHETRPVDSTWVHLDLGRWGCVVRARLRRLRCPTHGVVVEAVPFARPREALAHPGHSGNELLQGLSDAGELLARAVADREQLCRVVAHLGNRLAEVEATFNEKVAVSPPVSSSERDAFIDSARLPAITKAERHLVVLNPSADVIAERELAWGRNNSYREWQKPGMTLIEAIESMQVDLKQTPRRGLWLDTSGQTPQQTVESILAGGIGESRW